MEDTIHQYAMERCFELAEKGRGKTKGNPLVGAVLVYQDKIISEGFHSVFGGNHAEVDCLKNITDKFILDNATLYISLEPCNFHGKTPACTELIKCKGIKKVVIGSLDFNPMVKGNGIEYLVQSGIACINLNLTERQIALNTKFFINQTQKRSFFVGKFSTSKDGFIGNQHKRTKITTEEMDYFSHQIRAESDAILVGKNTWLADVPRLDARLFNDSKPKIVILSSEPLENIVPREDQEIINLNLKQDHTHKTVKWIKLNTLDPLEIGEKLLSLGLYQVMVEGGSQVLESFDQAECLDALIEITNDRLILSEGVSKPNINFVNYDLVHQFEHQNQSRKEFIHKIEPKT
jgi:diaminohydroxyphosphoribosylaminopyrimidine deaminase / 5-amino-6-(5-phosphoribosylamino)uracil reductase